jgi:hypothetical protein
MIPDPNVHIGACANCSGFAVVAAVSLSVRGSVSRAAMVWGVGDGGPDGDLVHVTEQSSFLWTPQGGA